MELFLQICGVGILASVLALVLQRANASVGVMVSVGACILLGLAAVAALEPVVDFFRSLQRMAGLSGSLMSPFMKTVGIGILTQITAAICQDAGQNAVARMVELCGSVIALYLSLPLLTAVLNLLADLTGGT